MAERIHEHHLRVHYSETDQMGVAHHASYLVYFEESRTRMMAELGCSYSDIEREGVGLPVRRVEVRYRAPSRFDEELVVRTKLAEVRTASLSFEYEVFRPADEKLVATGWTELACVDLRSPDRRLVPLPEDLRRRLEPQG